jgi:hypothetical protein
MSRKHLSHGPKAVNPSSVPLHFIALGKTRKRTKWAGVQKGNAFLPIQVIPLPLYVQAANSGFGVGAAFNGLLNWTKGFNCQSKFAATT